MWDAMASRKLRLTEVQAPSPTSIVQAALQKLHTTLSPAIERRNHGPALSLCSLSRSDAGSAALDPHFAVLDLYKPLNRTN